MEQYLGIKLVNAEPKRKLISAEASRKGIFKEYQEGYKVIYEDGYESWSPKDTFEKAYRKINGLTFGLAIEALKLGECVARKGWPESYEFVTKQIPTVISDTIVPKMTSLSDNTKEALDKIFKDEHKQLDAIYYNDQLILFKDSNLVDSYVATTEDILAEDWVILD